MHATGVQLAMQSTQMDASTMANRRKQTKAT